MNHKQKLGYMALGALIMLIGMGVGSTFFTPPIEAQHNGLFNEITCRKLWVVDKNGNPAIRLESDENGNRMFISDENGKGAILLSISIFGNSMAIYDKNENPAILLDSDEDGNSMVICDQNRKVSFSFEAYPHRNELAVYNKSSGAGIGFYGDSNEARQITWIPEQEE